jgi:tetratricopeptide (TPR) repeat protein
MKQPQNRKRPSKPMQRTLNVRLLFWTLGTIVVVATAVHVVHTLQVRRNASAYLRQADLAFQEGNLPRAATFLSQYLSFEPGDTEALTKYGLTLDQAAKKPATRARAVQVLEQVLRRDPDRHDIRERLARILIDLGRYREAAVNLEALPPRWPNKGETAHLLGWCHESNGDYDKAAAAYRTAIKEAPAQIDSYVFLAELLHQHLDQWDEAVTVLDEMVAANVQNSRAYQARASYHKQTGRLKEAQADISKALTLTPRRASLLLAAADLAQATGDVDQGRTFLVQGLKAEPANLVFYISLAHLEERAGRRDRAVAALRDGLHQQPQAAELRLRLADLLLDAGQTAEAEQHVLHLRQDESSPAFADYLEARIHIRRQSWLQATRLLESCSADLVESAAWGAKAYALLGRCYEKVGDIDGALLACNRAVLLDGNNLSARLGLGSALLAAGRIDEGLRELDRITGSLQAPAELWALLGRAHLLRNLSQPPAKRDWTGLEKALERTVKATPDDVLIPILRAELLTGDDQYLEATELLEQARQQRPEEPKLWAASADLAARQGQWDSAFATIEEGRQQLGDSLELRLAACRLVWARGGASAAQQLAALAQDLKKLRPDEQIRLLRHLGDAFHRLGDSARAKQVWAKIAEQQPRDLRIRFLLFEQALTDGDGKVARELATELKRLESDNGILWRYAQAALLVRDAKGDRQALAQARTNLEEVTRRQPGWSSAAVLQGRVAELEGDVDRALGHYLTAVDLGERQPRTVQRLVQFLYQRGKMLDADRALRKLEDDRPLGKDLARLGAEVALANKDFARALRLAQEAVSSATGDYRELLWHARILEHAKKEKSAEDVLRRAVDLAGHAPDVWIALVEFLARTGQRGPAEAVLAQAKAKLADERLDPTLARCHEALGRLEQAETLYRNLLAARPGDLVVLSEAVEFFRRHDQPAKAEPVLRRLVDPNVRAPADLVARARRLLALTVSADGSSKGAEEAQALLEQNRRTGRDTIADDRVRAAVLANRPGQRRDGLGRFEATLSLQPCTQEEQLLLAQLHDAAGDHFKARDLFLGLLADDADNPQYLAAYVRSLLQRGTTASVPPYLTKLEQREPNSPRTRGLKELYDKVVAAEQAN